MRACFRISLHAFFSAFPIMAVVSHIGSAFVVGDCVGRISCNIGIHVADSICVQPSYGQFTGNQRLTLAGALGWIIGHFCDAQTGTGRVVKSSAIRAGVLSVS